MENSHLIVILKTFSKKEQREFRKWLESPVHNQRDDVLLLFDYLTNNNHLDSEKYLKKEKVFGKLFPKEPYDDAKCRQTMHFLLKAVEEYLVWQELQEDKMQIKISLASVYRKRKLGKVFQRTIRNIEELQEVYPYQNEHYWRNEYLLQLEKYTATEWKEQNIEINLQEVSNALDVAYLAEKLLQTCRMLSHQKLYKTTYVFGMIDFILKYVEQENLLHIPAIGIYYFTYKTLTEQENEPYFEALETLIQTHGHQFPSAQSKEMYLFAINYCVGRSNTGEEKYTRKLFELYKKGFEKKILVENNMVTPAAFHNAAAIGLKLKEYQWVDYFIHEHKQYLEPNHRDSFFFFNLAKLRYEQKDYDSAMRLLAQTDFDNILIQLNAKTMLLKMYYELDETDAIESLLESMRTYLSRKEIIGYHRSNYQNIIRYTKKLVRLNPYNKLHKEKLQQEIAVANPLTEREWLLRQLEAV